MPIGGSLLKPITLIELQENYYYKTDLIKLCREYHLPTYGTKAELINYLSAYLSGTPANEIHTNRSNQHRSTLKAEEITLDTKLIGSGFSFNTEARKFFAAYFKVDHFSFKKEMAIIKRQAEINNDQSITVGDLIKQSTILTHNIGQKQQLLSNDEEQTYQWNNFVKDFCQSPESQNFTNKLKVAAILWQHVKLSKQPKRYSDKLLNIYASEVATYSKLIN